MHRPLMVFSKLWKRKHSHHLHYIPLHFTNSAYNPWYLLWQKVHLPLLFLLLSLIGGAIGYRIFYPEVSWYRLFFMSAITLSTVGFSDTLNVENSLGATVYTIFLIFLGLGLVFYSISILTTFLIEGSLQKIFIIYARHRRIQKMKDHHIICGAGKTGKHIAIEMYKSSKNFLVIDLNQHALKELQTIIPDILLIQGDASHEAILKQARIENAISLLACLSDDKENLFLTITAKLLQPNLKIISRALNETLHKKLYMAGATKVVSPNFLGGRHMAQEILRPQVISFLDKILLNQDDDIHLEENIIPMDSHLIGKTLGEVQIPKHTALLIIAYSHDGENFIYNPSPDVSLEAGATLIYIGRKEEHEKLSQFLQKDSA